MKIAALLFAALLVPFLASPPLHADQGQPSGPAPVAALLDAYVEEWLPLNPLAATRLGDHRFDHVFANPLSDDHRRQLRGVYVDRAKQIDASRLGPQDALNLEIFRWELTNRLALMDNDDYLRPMHQLDAVPTQFALLGSGANVHPFKTVRDFRLVPKSAIEIRPIEKFRAATASAHYLPGRPDGSRPGAFYVPIPDARHFTDVDTDDLYLHEAVPGHHFQISLQQELDLPRFRKYSFYSAFGEGWAIYAETLGPQLGVMRDPYHRYGRLIGKLRAATSLVIDTGLHAKGWSRERALEFFRDNAIGSEEMAENRVERYMASPGQTLSYLIGEKKMLELRARAERVLGRRFDLRDFHDQVLKDGSMPLAVLEKKIDAWIRTRDSGSL